LQRDGLLATLAALESLAAALPDFAPDFMEGDGHAAQLRRCIAQHRVSLHDILDRAGKP
jgi:hypothetical protein